MEKDKISLRPGTDENENNISLRKRLAMLTSEKRMQEYMEKRIDEMNSAIRCRELPVAETYEQEYQYTPWGKIIERVIDTVVDITPKYGHVLDLMCGPGHVLGEIHKRRGDLKLKGVDSSEKFIRYAKEKHPSIRFNVTDVTTSDLGISQYDAVICTAGIHHLPYEKQVPFLKELPLFLKYPDGICVLGDPMIDDYSDEKKRKIASAKLVYKYLLATIESGAPDEVVSAAIDIMYNDVMKFEYKTSAKKLESILEEIFPRVTKIKAWPSYGTKGHKSGYGDYCFICRNNQY